MAENLTPQARDVLPAVSGDSLRTACSAWPTGVAVVTGFDAGQRPVGMAINSFTSLSLDPPMVLFCPARISTTWPTIRRAGCFAVNVLAFDQHDISLAFARRGGDKFRGISWTGVHGVPVVDDCSSTIACELDHVLPGGDHEIAVGRVVSAWRAARPPLVFHEGGLRTLGGDADDLDHRTW